MKKYAFYQYIFNFQQQVDSEKTLFESWLSRYNLKGTLQQHRKNESKRELYMQIGVATTHVSMREQEKQNMQPLIIKPPSNLSNAVTILDKLPKNEDVTPSPSPPIIEHIKPIPPPIIDL